MRSSGERITSGAGVGRGNAHAVCCWTRPRLGRRGLRRKSAAHGPGAPSAPANAGPQGTPAGGACVSPWQVAGVWARHGLEWAKMPESDEPSLHLAFSSDTLAKPFAASSFVG